MTLDLSRGDFLGAASSGVVAVAGLPAREVADAASGTARLRMRWYGGGVYELATADDATVVLVDAWIWSNTGFERFGIAKPPELASPDAYVAHIKARRPSTFIIAVTHDHGDHVGDYFPLLTALGQAGVAYRTVGQSDLFRVGLTERFRAAGVDPGAVVLAGGNGLNFGGSAADGGARLTLVPAVHSCGAGFPAAGFLIELGGLRVYAAGDTDLYGDMALLRTRYAPDVAVLCAGNGAFTMGPEDAAAAAQLTGARMALPVHYAHNPRVLGPECADRFRTEMHRIAPRVAVATPKPGDTVAIDLAPQTAPQRTHAL